MANKDTEEYLEQWETLINSVDKTDIPIRFVNRIIFDSSDYDIGTQTDIATNQLDIAQMRANGYPDDVIQEIINEIMKEIQDLSGTMDFLLNVPEVARVAQEETDKYLK
ncbi:MAG: hypothetical protein DRI24_23255 [Deltaproteobacteria bacterium]|nr:MAG: hypothetical protein DRI24_23255 [Deltaproteobacteria bacterium]